MPVAVKDIDPLHRFREGAKARVGAAERPIPLASTKIDVAIRGLFATVTTTRVFRNAEDASIEATLTYPIPVDAIAHGLKVCIDGRKLIGVAQAKKQARETYEDAIDSGKTAILHEELLKGVHMVSVGHIPPGKEVEVEISWSKPLAFIGATPSLRVPNTVAEVYGRSPLLPVDDLATDPVKVFEADVTVSLDAGVAHIEGRGAIASGENARIALDRPLVVTVAGFSTTPIEGVSADGRKVTLSVEKCATGDLPLKLAVLFDRSGSTRDPLDDAGRTSTWEACHEALSVVAKRFRHEDVVELWEFDNMARHVGTASGEGFAKLLRDIGKPRGGTEIGLAIRAVVETNSAAKDIVVMTDGRSHALDPENFGACGRRISAVLCGTNSLDANIGHVVALTGGQIVVASAANVVEAIETVFDGARLPSSPAHRKNATRLPRELCELRAGAKISIFWSEAGAAPAGAPDAIGIYAAGLALPLLTEAAAAATAVAHGIACHLTSLVVVDDASEAQEGIPATRKVPLSAPYEAHAASAGLRERSIAAAPPPSFAHRRSAAPVAAAPPPPRPTREARATWFKLPAFLRRAEDRAPPSGARSRNELQRLAQAIDWDGEANALVKGDLSALPETARALIQASALHPQIAALAHRNRGSAIVILLGLLARFVEKANRAAERVARQALKGLSDAEVEALSRALGL